MTNNRRSVRPVPKKRAPPADSEAPASEAAPSPLPVSNVVTLGKRTITLKAPTSLAIAYDVMAMADRAATRGLCAALGVCWEAGPDLGCPVKYASCNYDMGKYGGAVFDALSERGIPTDQIVEAAAVAYRLLQDKIVSAAEVKAAEGF